MRLSCCLSRTPPGVRELKRGVLVKEVVHPRRTPPGVRELKLLLYDLVDYADCVAPLPGCVN